MKEMISESTGEKFSFSSDLATPFGLARLAIYFEVLPPGRRSSRPHYHSKKEEGVYILKGRPDLWIDGVTTSLKPGDFVGFKPGNIEKHTILNQTQEPVEYLVLATKESDDVTVF